MHMHVRRIRHCRRIETSQLFFLCTHRAIKHLLEALKPYTVENGGVLKVEHVWYVEGRGNLIIEYTPEGATGE